MSVKDSKEVALKIGDDVTIAAKVVEFREEDGLYLQTSNGLFLSVKSSAATKVVPAEPVKEPVKEPAKEPVKEPAKEPVKEPVKEPAKEPAKAAAAK